jgi:hypothetical protein
MSQNESDDPVHDIIKWSHRYYISNDFRSTILAKTLDMCHLNLEFEFMSYGFEYVHLVILIMLKKTTFCFGRLCCIGVFLITFESSFILVST